MFEKLKPKLKRFKNHSFNLLKLYKKGIILGFIIPIILLPIFYSYQKEDATYIEYPKFQKMVSENQIKEVYIDLTSPTFLLKDIGNKVYKTDNPRTVDFKVSLLNQNIKVNELSQNPFKKSSSNLIGTIMYMIFLLFILNKMNPSQKKYEISEKIVPLGFDDIAGCKELKKDLLYVVDFLKNPKKYNEMGVRMPKGIALYGPPGTGKTLIAKVIAGTAGVPFFSVNASDFVEVYVGVGASRVKELYKKAKKKAPCIIFIDEIDAVGVKRGEGHSEKDQTIMALLNELDGFNGTEGIITIIATNRLKELDPALVRPGRIDKIFMVPLPEREDRKEILMVHGKNKKFSEEVNFDNLAKITIGFSGAMIETLLNEAAFLATIADRKEIINKDIEKSFYRMVLKGDEKETLDNRDKEELRIVSYHEAGHALATKLLTNDEVSRVTILSSTVGAGGVTFRIPEEISLYSKEKIKNIIKVMYAGRAAEKIYFNENEEYITTGAAMDIEEATHIIKDFVCKYGMNDKIGLINTQELAKTGLYLDNNVLLNEFSKISNELFEEIFELMKENKDLLKDISNELYEKESLTEEELMKIIEKYNIHK